MTSALRIRALAAMAFSIAAVLAPFSAPAAEIPLPDHALMVRVSTAEIMATYGRSISNYEAWAGLAIRPGAGAVSAPVGVSREWIRGSRGVYRLSARVTVAPMLLARDETDFALSAGLGVDNRFVGERLSGLFGLEMDSALVLTSMQDHRNRFLVVAGLGRTLPWLDVWLTGRAGYTSGGAGGGSLFTELGVAVTFPLSKD